MGHIHLKVLPGSRRWKAVVALLEEGAPDDEGLRSAAVAAEHELLSANDDAAYVECVRLLSMVPYAARDDSFGHSLRGLGIPVGDDPDLLGVTSAVGEHLDRFVREHGRPSDFGELARRALTSAFTRLVGGQLPGLFEASREETRLAFRRLSSAGNFAVLARSFFTELASQTLSYWLDRALAVHVGAGRRFEHAGQRVQFEQALDQYSFEASRIIKEFAGGWYGKTIRNEGAVSTRSAAVFGAVAFKKIVEELQRKRDARV
jgi:hypothetical protein